MRNIPMKSNMEEENYNSFSIEDLTKFALEISEKKNNELVRKLVLGCNKYGVLDYLKHLYKALNLSDEEIKALLDRDKKELKDGYYTICNGEINFCGL